MHVLPPFMAADRTIMTKHGSITLDQLAEMQPGMARLMVEYAERFWTMYYAAKASNWALANYMHSEMMKLGKIVPIIRPKYAEGMAEFERTHMEPLLAAITANDGDAFEVEYRRTLAASDTFHDRFAKPFIRFRLPPEPPPYLEMAPNARAPTE